MRLITTDKTWRQKLQENSSIWGSLLLWFCGATILLAMMLFFARG